MHPASQSNVSEWLEFRTVSTQSVLDRGRGSINLSTLIRTETVHRNVIYLLLTAYKPFFFFVFATHPFVQIDLIESAEDFIFIRLSLCCFIRYVGDWNKKKAIVSILRRTFFFKFHMAVSHYQLFPMLTYNKYSVTVILNKISLGHIWLCSFSSCVMLVNWYKKISHECDRTSQKDPNRAQPWGSIWKAL